MKILSLVLFSFLSVISYAQSKKFSFKLGSEYSLPRKSEDLSFFGNEKDGIVNLSLKKDELNISRFDPKSLNQTVEKTIELPELTKNFNSETVVDFGTNYYWLHSDWDKDAEKEFLYYDKVDVVTGKITAANNKMIEATKMAGTAFTTGFYSYKIGNKYQFNYDADGKKMLVSYRLTPEERNDKKNYDKIGLYVFDDNMKKLWGSEFTMPYTEAIMDNSDFSIDSHGNAYMLAKVYDSEKRKEVDKETGKAGYHYEVLKFIKDNKKIINTTISIDDYFIREASLIENSLHDMVIACTYSKKSKGTGTDGIFLAIMDQGGKISNYKKGYYEFPLAELEKFESARSKRKMGRKDDYEAPNLKVRDVVVESDGSVFISCEEYYVVARTYSDGKGYSRTTYTYYYEDILGAKINATGNFEWLRKIPKKQSGTRGRGTMSFKLISDATGYYFLYLDNKKNMELEEDEVPKYHVDGFGGQVVVSKVDNKGVVTKELVFDTREEDVMLYPSQFKRINGNQFIGRATLKKNLYQPLLITVN
ncbi:MAG TPA: hypothetical protein VK498_12740 [Ferruginibacter sp.]|nr:hypothetical protein [Ferruginibacter sp.]